MSHHFDTKLAKEDPSLNICDFYLFEGSDPSTTVMAMTVNPDTGLSSSDVLHMEGLYAFRFDLNGDAREDLVFKFRFGAPRHADEHEHVHLQDYRVLRAEADAIPGDAGELLLEGETGGPHSRGAIRSFVGVVPDLFAGDGFALRTFMKSLYEEQRFNADAFLHQQNFFDKRNIVAIVLEVPNDLIGRGTVNAWATVSLYGHAPEMQVSRWGLPLVSNFFLGGAKNENWKELYNTSAPSDDHANFAQPIAEFAEQISALAASAHDPAAYGRQIAARLCPVTLPYTLGTPASFTVAAFNGRPLADDAMDVMLALASNLPLADGVAPNPARMIPTFPYFGAPYTAAQQEGVTPVPRPPKK
jgi:hypothetical protein